MSRPVDRVREIRERVANRTRQLVARAVHAAMTHAPTAKSSLLELFAKFGWPLLALVLGAAALALRGFTAIYVLGLYASYVAYEMSRDWHRQNIRRAVLMALPMLLFAGIGTVDLIGTSSTLKSVEDNMKTTLTKIDKVADRLRDTVGRLDGISARLDKLAGAVEALEKLDPESKTNVAGLLRRFALSPDVASSDKALSWFLITRIKPKSAEAWYYLGDTWYRPNLEWRSAIEAFNEYLKLRPPGEVERTAWVLLIRGQSYYELSKIENRVQNLCAAWSDIQESKKLRVFGRSVQQGLDTFELEAAARKALTTAGLKPDDCP